MVVNESIKRQNKLLRVRAVRKFGPTRASPGRPQPYKKSAKSLTDFADFQCNSIFAQKLKGEINLILISGTFDAQIRFTLLLMRVKLVSFSNYKIHLFTQLTREDQPPT